MSNITKSQAGAGFEPPTQERLKELLDYDPATGILTWKKRRKGVPHDGAIAGCLTGDGYLKVSVDGTQYRAHQVIWCFMTGSWVPFIDHKDCDGLNNSWSNLRASTFDQNNQNMKSKKTASSPSKLKGAYWDKRRKTWHSRIMAGRKLVLLGNFDSAEEAHAAYVTAADKLHGEFARIS